MHITQDQVAYIAKLAYFKLTPNQIKMFVTELNDIFNNINKLSNINTKNIPPTHHVLALTGAIRKDQVHTSLSRKVSLSNAPVNNGINFIVPQIR